MKTSIKWTEGMHLEAECGTNRVDLDAKAPLGQEKAMTPKELVAVGLGGCTAMDVIALLKKHKQTMTKFNLDVDVEPTSGKHPVTFQKVQILFDLHGQIDPAIALESVRLSQTKYCGVSAMIAKACPIYYTVQVNGEKVGEGQARFE